MRILWSSNAPWAPSGYGVQTKRIVPALKAAGHDVALFAFWGLEGGQLNLSDIPIYPKAMHPWGCDILGPHALHFQADIVITLIDAWVQEPSQLPPSCKWVPYFPVDSVPVSPRVTAKVRDAHDRIVFTRFAEREVHRAGLSCRYAPHVVDVDVFKPMDKAEARKKVNLPPDRFIAGCVAANKGTVSRKSWPQIMEAWHAFCAEHPDALLYLHTQLGEGGGDCCDLVQLVNHFGLQKNIVAVDQYLLFLGLDESYLAAIYNGIDVLLNPAMGEGFGVPILEAQACGCPVITGGWTSMPELTFAGWQIPVEEAFPFWMNNYGAYQYLPQPASILAMLDKAYMAVDDRAALSEKAVTGAAHYETGKVMREHWLPVLEEIGGNLERAKAKIKLVKFVK